MSAAPGHEPVDRDARRRAFLTAVAHDIRGPANAISLMAEVIARSGSNPALAEQVPEMAAKLRAQALSLVTLVTNIIDAIRLDLGDIELRVTVFPLRELLEEEFRAGGHKNLHLTASGPALWLRTDRVRLGRAVRALAAYLSTRLPRAAARLELALTPSCIDVQVDAVGLEFTPEEQSMLFDELYQLRHPPADGHAGTAVGLVLSERLIRALGGALTAEPSPDRGTEFRIRLPNSLLTERP